MDKILIVTIPAFVYYLTNVFNQSKLKLQEKNGTEVCYLYTGIFYSSLNLMANAINQGRKTTEFKKRACRV